MSSQAGVQLFLQRIFAAKFLQDDAVDGLVRGISRGTGHDYGGKNGFVQEANRALADIGYMLVRVVFNGSPYYVLKDLESTSYGGAPGGPSADNEGDMSPSHSSQTTTGRQPDSVRAFDCKFTSGEVSVYMDAMSHIVRERTPLQMADPSAGATSWKSLCSRHAISDSAAQQALADRFKRDGWLVVDPDHAALMPGVRFHVEFLENYDLSGHPDCVFCGGKIICMNTVCERCGSSSHSACTETSDSGERLCRRCMRAPCGE